MEKIKVTFDGWHCFSRKQQKEILAIARSIFTNSNFCDLGLMIEDEDRYKIHKFCLDILESFKKTLNNWDGYKIVQLSTRTLISYSDKKRKLSLEYFKELVKEDFQKSKLVLAGILYLDPEEVLAFLKDYENEVNNLFQNMTDIELDQAYKNLILFASTKIRTFYDN